MVSGKFTCLAICLAVLSIVQIINETEANPQIDLLGGYDVIGICITNCAQCKKMFGEFFEGHLCAESCIQFKGKMIPDCEDINSIAPFLNKLI
ncbi:eclosion hormone-like [Toxorhynchites rutilus septentrionalis]|uniref:eclosion hormone-like n=1 Tax=Toxorhynchites rutilus septentrionalis TaxID=329112 RepID=UPI00247ADDAA|nr:eclosion hormone-like [Toxorhynchites rutilus septentrionalis]